jgi:protein-L-isoaspartate(D-aspartate) O-methyltransferase
MAGNQRLNEGLRERIFDFYKTLNRREFIDDTEIQAWAELDRPLSIGHGQTISQPSLVLAMTQELEPEPNSRVLEIGTGSGFQTALLAQFAEEVYTIERIEELAEKSRERLLKLGYTNIRFKVGDGSEGWPEFAPFDRIMVTAAAGKIPHKLLEQLKAGGRMILPLGPVECQELLLIIKDEAGMIKQESLGVVRFVEFRGKYGWQ